MIVAHATWVPAEAGEPADLFVWGEVEGESPWRPAAGAGRQDARLHPRCASPAALRDALARLGLEGPLVGATAALLLPSGPVDPGARAEDGAVVAGSSAPAGPGPAGGSTGVAPGAAPAGPGPAGGSTGVAPGA